MPQAKAEELGLSWDAILAKAEELRNKDPSEVIPKAAAGRKRSQEPWECAGGTRAVAPPCSKPW